MLIALGGHSMLHCSAGAQAELHVSVPPRVEVMRGEQVALDCTPREHPEHYVLEWFLVSALCWELGRRREEGGPGGLVTLAAISSAYTGRLLRRPLHRAIRSCLSTSQMRRLVRRKALASCLCRTGMGKRLSCRTVVE